jgi:hypothetical protein
MGTAVAVLRIATDNESRCVPFPFFPSSAIALPGKKKDRHSVMLPATMHPCITFCISDLLELE